GHPAGGVSDLVGAAEGVAEEVDRGGALAEGGDGGAAPVGRERELDDAALEVRQRALGAGREVLLVEVPDPVPVRDEDDAGAVGELGARLVPRLVVGEPLQRAGGRPALVEAEAVEVVLAEVVGEEVEAAGAGGAGGGGAGVEA